MDIEEAQDDDRSYFTIYRTAGESCASRREFKMRCSHETIDAFKVLENFTSVAALPDDIMRKLKGLDNRKLINIDCTWRDIPLVETEQWIHEERHPELINLRNACLKKWDPVDFLNLPLYTKPLDNSKFMILDDEDSKILSLDNKGSTKKKRGQKNKSKDDLKISI